MSVELEELRKLVEKLARDVEELKMAREEKRKQTARIEVVSKEGEAISKEFVESVLKLLEDKLGEKPDGGLVLISGIERRKGKVVDSFMSAVDLESIAKCPPFKIAKLTSSLSSENRIRIMQSLLKGVKTASELSEETGLEGGQLYHHLKELIMAGYVQMVERGKYALTSSGCIAIRTISCLASIPGIIIPTPEEVEKEFTQ